jgi:hypothetical protein
MPESRRSEIAAELRQLWYRLCVVRSLAEACGLLELEEDLYEIGRELLWLSSGLVPGMPMRGRQPGPQLLRPMQPRRPDSSGRAH